MEKLHTFMITTSAVALAVACLTGTASAQLYSYGSAYNNYGYSNRYGSTYGNFYNQRTYGSSYYRSAYPYNYSGYGGYGYYNRPTYIYRSPGSFDRNDDAYHRDYKTDTQKAVQRFRDLREDTRSRNNYYSNDIYEQNHPHDASYYNRNIR